MGGEVCVLDGGRVPYVLRGLSKAWSRQVKSGYADWKLIGECYVSGLEKEKYRTRDAGRQHVLERILV